MNEYLVDEITLTMDGLPSSATATLVKLSGEMALSTYYHFEITFLCPASIPLLASDMLNTAVSLGFAEYSSTTSEAMLEGVITDFTQGNYLSTAPAKGAAAETSYIEYIVIMRPQASWMLHSYHTQYFTQVSLKAIIQNIVYAYASSMPQINVIYPANMSTEPLDFVFQYEESDANFISRLLEKSGMFFYFQYDTVSATWQMVICNDSTTLKPSQFVPTLNYQNNPKQVANATTNNIFMSLNMSNTPPPTTVTVSSYDYHNPSISPISHTATSSSHLAQASFIVEKTAVEVTTVAGVTALANTIMGAYEAASEVLEIEIAANYLLPGETVNLANHPIKKLNGSYLVTKVTYDFNFTKSQFSSLGLSASASQTETIPVLGKGRGVSHTVDVSLPVANQTINRVTLIPAATPYYHPLQTKIPRISGFLPAIITQPSDITGENVYLDDAGQYAVNFLCTPANEDDVQYFSVRKMEPSLFNASGFFYPLKVGTEVMIGFQDGNPDMPIVIGALANAANQALITAYNNNHAGHVLTPNGSSNNNTPANGLTPGILAEFSGGGASNPPSVTSLAQGEHLSVNTGGAVTNGSSGAQGSSPLKTTLQGTLAVNKSWSAGSYSFDYDGSLDKGGLTITYPNGGYVAVTPNEHVEYNKQDKYQVVLGNGYNATIGNTYSICVGNSTSKVYGNSNSTIGSSTNSVSSVSTIYGDSTSTINGNSSSTINGDSSSTIGSADIHRKSTSIVYGDEYSTTFGNIVSSTYGSETSMTGGAMTSCILGTSNTIMVGEGSFIFLGVNIMLTVGAQISITSGWEMSLQQVGHLHAGPILTKVAAVLATRLCGATLIEQTPGSIDFVTPGIVTIDASAVQVAAGVHSNSAGVTLNDNGVVNNVAGMTSTEGEILEI